MSPKTVPEASAETRISNIDQSLKKHTDQLYEDRVLGRTVSAKNHLTAIDRLLDIRSSLVRSIS
jgi:hypothetical protein